MKKSILVITACLLLMIIIGYFLYCYYFPMADIIDYPEYDLIDSIIIYDNNRTEIDMNENDYELFYKFICESIPTRQCSVNEFPYIKPFYTVKIDTNEIITYKYGHIYENNGTAYLEIPYMGIYKIDNDVLKLLVK